MGLVAGSHVRIFLLKVSKDFKQESLSELELQKDHSGYSMEEGPG